MKSTHQKAGVKQIQKPVEPRRRSAAPKPAEPERKQLDATLQASEEKFRRLFETAQDGILLLDAKTGEIFEANPFIENMLDYAHDELVGKKLWDIGPFKDVLSSQEAFRRLQNKRYIRYEDLPLETKDGRHCTVEFISNVYRVGSQKVIQCNIRNITEHRQTEEALRESEERFREIFENMSSGVVVYEAVNGGEDFKINNFNRAAERIEKTSRESVTGKTICEVFPGVKAFGLFDVLQRVWKTGKPEFFPVNFYQDSREAGWRENYVSRLPSGEVVTVYDDVTERKQAEQALRESEVRFRGAVEAAGAVPYFYNYETETYDFMGEGILALTGYPVQEMTPALLGSLVHEMYMLGENAHLQPGPAGQSMRAGKIKNWRCDNLIVTRDGKTRWVADASVAVFGKDGKVIGTMGSLQDITERKQTEEVLARQAEELRQRNEELARLYRASGSLISTVPFDLQTLARTIVEVILREFGQANCSVFLVRKDSNELNRIAVAGPYADQVSKNVLTLDGAGLVPQAIRLGQVINTPDVDLIPAYVPAWGAARSELTIPLKIGAQVIGAIDVQSSEPDAFKADDERLMSIFAERAALTLEHGRLYEQTERQMQNLISLRTIDMAISSSFDVNVTLGILLDEVIKQLGAHAADVLIFSPVTHTFQYSCGRGFYTQALQYTNLRLGEGYAGRAASERITITIQDLDQNLAGLHKSLEFSREGFVAYVGIPLIAKGQIKGVLEVFHRTRLDLDRERAAFMEMLAGQAGIAIDNAELFEHLQDSNAELTMAYDETIEGWSRAMDLRDTLTEGHSQRVTALTLKLANSMGFRMEELTYIRRGALLHDIGKMGIPDSILRKPGELTGEEWEIMRKHPQFARDMLAPIAYLRPALDIPYCHHEKWDGTGYPRGLKGEQIPLAARIFAVVDVWDALLSDRPYRKAWPGDRVREYIRTQAGQHFDPKVVEKFLGEVPDDGRK